jgi:single-strand DNA-binding protein
MENNTVIGNICADPTLRMTRKSSRAMARFTIAVNHRRKVGEDEFVDRPAVFHRIICFGTLAENVSNSLRKGMEVVAVGGWIDDSYEDERGQKHTHVAMEARAVGASLRWATASITKVERQARVIPLPDQATTDPGPPPDQNDHHEPDEFSANSKPPDPETETARATRKGERRTAKAS